LGLIYLLIFQGPLIIQVAHHYSVEHSFHFYFTPGELIHQTDSPCPIHNFEFVSFIAATFLQFKHFPVPQYERSFEAISKPHLSLFTCYRHRAPPIA